MKFTGTSVVVIVVGLLTTTAYASAIPVTSLTKRQYGGSCLQLGELCSIDDPTCCEGLICTPIVNVPPSAVSFLSL